MEVAQHSEPKSSVVFIDAHVHYHRCYVVESFLDSARANFRRATALANVADPVCCLLLADNSGQDSISEFLAAERSKTTRNWSFQGVQNDSSLLAYRLGKLELVIIKGRQIVTSEEVEILALASDQHFRDGLTFLGTLKAVSDSTAIPVMPWGFGKWWLSRGKLVASVLRQPAFPEPFSEETFLGDNSCRTRLLGRPRMFELAQARRGRILPGSDPLPIRSHMHRAGSYGFVLHGAFDSTYPSLHLKALLKTNREQPATFGHLRGLGGFCRDQSSMQWRRFMARIRR